jgi:phosphohistidine phosphatase
MALYLVQHGKSLPREQDPDQGLSQEGLAEVKRIAGVAAGYCVRPWAIRHSGRKRARQTARVLAEALLPGGGEAEPIASTLKTDDNVMLVGHLPFMERLTGFLVTGSAERLVFKFQNGGIVCLDKKPEDRFWFIKWTLMPKIGE